MMKEQERIPASKILEKNVKKIIERNKPTSGKMGVICSLAQLAKAMDITAPSLTHALKGNPRLDTIQKIADALNVPVTSLFNDPQNVYGEIVVDGKLTHFHSIEELQAAIKPKDYGDWRLI